MIRRKEKESRFWRMEILIKEFLKKESLMELGRIFGIMIVGIMDSFIKERDMV